jgi:hypothetical protein
METSRRRRWLPRALERRRGVRDGRMWRVEFLALVTAADFKAEGAAFKRRSAGAVFKVTAPPGRVGSRFMAFRRSCGRIFWPHTDKRARRSNDHVVQFVDWSLGVAQAFLNLPLYSWQAWLVCKQNREKPWPYFNYIYAAEWGAIIVWLALKTPPLWLLAPIAFWRVAEILTWYIKLLFDKGHRVLLEVERNLLFLVIDVLTFVTLLALLLRGGPHGGLWSRWTEAFAAFTLNGSPEGYGNAWATAVGILGAVGGLTLLGAGLGMLVGLVGQRIRYGEGGYTGPTRPPPPWESRF